MKTISVIAYNRPEYLKTTMEALSQCRGIEEYTVIVSVDDSQNQIETVAVAKASNPGSDIYSVWERTEQLGVDCHPQVFYELLMRISDFNVVFEDDCVPSPDALELVDWFYNHPERDDYACLCLFGNSLTQEHPLDLYEKMNFCPYGWAFTREKWETVFSPAWMCHSAGWDWSLGYAIQTRGLKTLNPSLSRVHNIGREKGVHMSPEYWDGWGKDLVASDGSHGKDYRIAMRLPEDYRQSHLEEWAKEAMKSNEISKP